MDIFILQKETKREKIRLQVFANREHAEKERAQHRGVQTTCFISVFPLLSPMNNECPEQIYALFFYDRIAMHEVLIGFYARKEDVQKAISYYQGKYLFSTDIHDFRIQSYPLK